MELSDEERYYHGRRMRRDQMKRANELTTQEKLYPMRYCLMISGAVLIIIDIGLFIGGIAVIAAGIDLDTYGFAAMIAVSVLTMVFACTSLICGCRARPPRSLAYEKPIQQQTEQRAPPAICVVPNSSSKDDRRLQQCAHAQPPQQTRWPVELQEQAYRPPVHKQAQLRPMKIQAAPQAQQVQQQQQARQSGRQKQQHPPQILKVQFQKEQSASDCSHNATYGGSAIEPRSYRQYSDRRKPQKSIIQKRTDR